MSNDDAVNDWDLGSGLDLDGGKVEITKAWVGPNNDIAAGAMFVNFEFTPLDEGDPTEQSFSVGKGWEADRTGENLVTESGKVRKLNMSSNFGILLGSAIELFGGKEEAAEHLGSPRHMPNWVGTMWEMGTIVKMKMNPTTKVEKEGTCWVFTQWLGSSVDADADKTEAKSTTKTAGKTATKVGPRGKTNKPAIPAGIDEEMWQQLVDLAVEVQDREDGNDHEDFMEAAMELDGVESNPAASKAVMGTRAGSVWDTAKKVTRDAE